MRDLNRRELLIAAGGVSTVALAGCTGGDGDEGDGDEGDGNENDDGDGNGADDSGDEIQGEGFDVLQDGDYELPADPSPEEFADRTGQDEVEITTTWREDQNPEFVFDPPFVQVDEGTTVRFVNGDGVFHTVTATESLENRSQSGTFNEQITSEGATFEWEADETGRQSFYCSPHAGFMFGAIEVV